mmetsp:Transcript_33665/g.41254  ORF Transcript_33665/g.41254 Transcript_33665/m.41254 type:complete len:86 (-) Transcript_33665:411-668(-)
MQSQSLTRNYFFRTTSPCTTDFLPSSQCPHHGTFANAVRNLAKTSQKEGMSQSVKLLIMAKNHRCRKQWSPSSYLWSLDRHLSVF